MRRTKRDRIKVCGEIMCENLSHTNKSYCDLMAQFETSLSIHLAVPHPPHRSRARVSIRPPPLLTYWTNVFICLP